MCNLIFNCRLVDRERESVVKEIHRQKERISGLVVGHTCIIHSEIKNRI